MNTGRTLPGAARSAPGLPTLLALLLAGGLLAAAACGPGDGKPAGETAMEREAVAEEGAQRYTVRGEVTGLAASYQPENTLRIHHEEIPEFVGYDGEVVGMASMSMPFPVAEEAGGAEGIEVGDKVRFTLEVTWEGSPPYRITEIEELPADTELDFGRDGDLPGEKGVATSDPTPP